MRTGALAGDHPNNMRGITKSCEKEKADTNIASTHINQSICLFSNTGYNTEHSTAVQTNRITFYKKVYTKEIV